MYYQTFSLCAISAKLLLERSNTCAICCRAPIIVLVNAIVSIVPHVLYFVNYIDILDSNYGSKKPKKAMHQSLISRQHLSGDESKTSLFPSWTWGHKKFSHTYIFSGSLNRIENQKLRKYSSFKWLK